MIDLRRAYVDEQAELEALQLRASIAWEEYRELILAHPDAIQLPHAHIFDGRVCVAERDGKVVGFYVVLPRTDGDAELDGLFVDPVKWRNGIGTLLVHEAARRAAIEGSSVLHVTANPLAEPFYLACGFVFVGLAQTRFKVARTMQKVLAPMPQRGC